VGLEVNLSLSLSLDRILLRAKLLHVFIRFNLCYVIGTAQEHRKSLVDAIGLYAEDPLRPSASPPPRLHEGCAEILRRALFFTAARIRKTGVALP